MVKKLVEKERNPMNPQQQQWITYLKSDKTTHPLDGEQVWIQGSDGQPLLAVYEASGETFRYHSFHVPSLPASTVIHWRNDEEK